MYLSSSEDGCDVTNMMWPVGWVGWLVPTQSCVVTERSLREASTLGI